MGKASGGQRGGRPTKLTRSFEGTPEERAKARAAGDIGCLVISAMEAGSTIRQACAFAHVDPRMVEKWRAMGEERPKSIYGRFRRRTDEARDWLKSMLAASVLAQAKKDWRAGAWMLERLDPETWGRKPQKVEMEIQGRVVSASVHGFVDLRTTLEDPRTQEIVDELLARIGTPESRDAGLGHLPALPGPEALGPLGQVLQVVGGKKDPAAHGEHAAKTRKNGPA